MYVHVVSIVISLLLLSHAVCARTITCLLGYRLTTTSSYAYTSTLAYATDAIGYMISYDEQATYAKNER